jgi:hypothetical protein
MRVLLSNIGMAQRSLRLEMDQYGEVMLTTK